MAETDHEFYTVKPDILPLPGAEANRSRAHRPGIGRQRNMPRKIPPGYYVYTISVDGVVRYIGKGKGLRLYSHMKEVRHRLNREFYEA
jgi:hypothetical protein